MADLEHDASALATVRAFLEQHEASSSEDEAPAEKFTPRPARLGLGADPNQAIQVTTTPGLSEANRRLGSALRRQARQLMTDEDDSDGSESEIESKARAVGKRGNRAPSPERKKKDSGNNRTKNSAKQMENGEKGEKGKEGSSSDEEWGDDVLRKMTEEQDSEFKTWANGFEGVDKAGGDARDGAVTNGGGNAKKKRKKIRSRRKNLKRDKRRRHELPAHLTEETLKAGRVRKSADGGWRFEASTGFGRKG